jgi:hypothetical protein
VFIKSGYGGETVGWLYKHAIDLDYREKLSYFVVGFKPLAMPSCSNASFSKRQKTRVRELQLHD